MNPRNTWWLVAIALGLFAYIVFFDRNLADTTTKARQAIRLFPDLEPVKINALEIARSNQTIRVERTDDAWRLITPPYPAQTTGIRNLLGAISYLPRYDYIPEQEFANQPNGRAMFGLQPPRASVTIQSSTRRVQFQIGSRMAVGNQLYLSIPGDRGVYVTDATWLELVPRTSAEWRDRRLVQMDHLVFDRVIVNNANRIFAIWRDPSNQTWTLRPVPAKADASRVNQLLRELRDTRVSQFVSDGPTADLERFGLQAPELDLTLAQGTNPVFQVQFGKSPTNDPGQVFARCLSSTNIVLVPVTLLELLRRPDTEFRDRTLLTFQPEAVDRIEIKAQETFALQRLANRSWQIEQPAPLAADSNLVHQFLDTLARIEIERFVRDLVTDFAPLGLTQPARHYALKASVTNAIGVTNQLLAAVAFSSKSIDTNRADLIYARRESEQSAFAVSAADVERLGKAAFEFRDRRIWRFQPTNVVSFTLTHEGRSGRWTRDASGKWTKDVLRNGAVEFILQRFGQLRALEWVAQGDKSLKLFFAENPTQLALELNENGKTQSLTIEFGKLSPSGDPYATISDETGSPLIFRFPLSLWKDFMQMVVFPLAPEFR